MSDLDQHPGWRWCTAEGSRQFDLEAGRQMSLREKIEWLEEMDILAQRFEQARDVNSRKSESIKHANRLRQTNG